jgi:RsiG-like
MLRDDFLDGLAEKSTDELRALRDECVATETSVSYVRRLVQGRADILVAELRRRLDGADPPDSAELIARLPEILSDHHRPPGMGRLPQTLEPPDPDPELVARLDAQVSPSELSALPDLPEQRLHELLTALQDFENEVSQRRRELFRAIDALQGELARRYQTGEESIETLLSD